MASTTRAKVTFRTVVAILAVVAFFYLSRPLYWKISATIQDIRQNKQTVSGGLSKIMYDAQRSVGWYYHDESDSGVQDRKASAKRRILRQVS